MIGWEESKNNGGNILSEYLPAENRMNWALQTGSLGRFQSASVVLIRTLFSGSPVWCFGRIRLCAFETCLFPFATCLFPFATEGIQFFRNPEIYFKMM